MTDTPSADPHHGFAYQPALDGLRAIAVLAVILYHLDYEWMSGGFLGVDTFFVLSGYLITSLLIVEYGSTGTVSLTGFWVRRAKRLLPAVLLVLLAVAGYGWLVASSDQLGTIRGDALATLVYVANWRFILDEASYFELWSEASPLRHMWSLAIEEQFYVVWPLIVLGLLRAGRGRLTLLAVVCGLGTVGSVVLMAVLADLDRSRAYFGTDTRAHSLLIGALLAVGLRHLPAVGDAGRRVIHLAGAVAVAAIGAAFVLVRDADLAFYRGGSAVFAVAVAVVITSGVIDERSPLRRALDRQPLRWIGHVSYGLYLWHWPLIVWLTPGRVGVDGVMLDVVRVAATVACAALSYYVVEQPVRHARVPKVQVARLAPAAMIVTGGAILAGTVGATTNPFDQSDDFEIAVIAPTTSDASSATDPPTTDAPTTSDTPTTSAGTTTPGDDPSSTTSTTTTSTTAPPPTISSVGLVGDSVAGTLAEAMGRALTAEGITFLDAHVHGCGVASGFTVTETGEPFPWSAECVERVPTTHQQLIDQYDPDLVVWHSTWETADRLEDDRFLEFASPEHDAALAAEIDAVMARLTARGARVVILVAPPNAPSEFIAEPDPSDMAHLAGLLVEAEARHPNLSIIDLNPIVCPGGPPCPVEVDDLTLRPDGGHYSDEAADWLVDRLLDRLLVSPT